jgi:hypothetical protein
MSHTQWAGWSITGALMQLHSSPRDGSKKGLGSLLIECLQNDLDPFISGRLSKEEVLDLLFKAQQKKAILPIKLKRNNLSRHFFISILPEYGVENAREQLCGYSVRKILLAEVVIIKKL